MVTVRPAKREEIPYLQKRLSETTNEQVNLSEITTEIQVAEEDGKIIGFLPARIWWQFEPLVLFDEVTNKVTRERAAYKLIKAAESWIADRVFNWSKTHSYFFVTKTEAFARLAKKFGCTQIYDGCKVFGKDL